MASTPPTISFYRARELLFRPGHLLQEIKNSKKREFVVTPGGPVTEAVARKILKHPLCREVDLGLFPGIPQSWTLSDEHNEESDDT
jgi:hypothetical protein